MRFMIFVKAGGEGANGTPADASQRGALARYHQALAQAGVLLDAAALQPSAQGWRLRQDAGARSLVEGPFADGRDPIAGYTLIQVRSRDEAMEWARRFPLPGGSGAGGEIEVRPLCEPDEPAGGAGADGRTGPTPD
jgi:hypothetical protein